VARILLLTLILCYSNLTSQNLNNKKFYTQVRHSCIATTNGAFDIYTFLVLDFKNNQIYTSYEEKPSGKKWTDNNAPITYRIKNDILYIARPVTSLKEMGLTFKYKNGNLLTENKDIIFKPSKSF
jgi:hypothetical protein